VPSQYIAAASARGIASQFRQSDIAEAARGAKEFAPANDTRSIRNPMYAACLRSCMVGTSARSIANTLILSNDTSNDCGPTAELPTV
jgi:hypothetical protein